MQAAGYQFRYPVQRKIVSTRGEEIMKKKLLSFVIAAAMVMGIPAALGSAGLNMPDEVTVAPVTANAKTTTSSIGSTRNSSTKATVSAYGSFDVKAKKAVCTILLQEKYNGKWRTARGLSKTSYTKTVTNSYSISVSKSFTVKSGKVYRAQILFSDTNSSGEHLRVRYTGAF